jgi:ornithine cyclodeaminase/alanine dehydrogenase-like protein (mu-crystallin family)
MGTTLVLTRRDVAAVLDLDACIAAVERAFAAYGAGTVRPPLVAGHHVDGGGFHVKAATLGLDRLYFAVKVNANFPRNRDRLGLPTIQGALALFDATDGRVLALLDSIEITALRTAAATAVAAKWLARRVASVVTVCGCGVQGRVQLRALARVRTLRRVFAWDSEIARAAAFAAEMASVLGVPVLVAPVLREATLESDVVLTCTTATRWFLGRADVRPGTFIAAVGADNEHKQELEPELLAASTVVADVLEQSATIGDLHHALAAGVMARDAVHAELGEVVAGRKAGRRAGDEIIVFDSTGTALQDVAAAAVVYERARAAGAGVHVSLGT